jgi:transcriptional regulator GlxA family with amidase domain
MKPSSRARGAGTRAKAIVFLGAPNTQILDVAGPFQIFVRASELYVKSHPGQVSPYNVLLASTTRRESVSTNCGLVLAGGVSYRVLRGPIDTLLVAGGTGVEEAGRNADDKLEKVASDCGFGSIQSLRRSFSRVLQVSPHDYRHRFRDARTA